MTDKKFTDEEVIKGLTCCAADNDYCDDCPYYEKETDKYCTNDLIKDALDLINRLQYEDEIHTGVIKNLWYWIDKQKAEIEMMRNYMHDNNLEWDLLSYSKRNDR